MAWESRNRGGRYYTRSRREGDRVIREYVGTGESAEMTAARDEWLREMKELRKIGDELAFRMVMDPVDQLDKDIENLHEVLKTELRRHLDGFGYHHHRGSWRRRRTP